MLKIITRGIFLLLLFSLTVSFTLAREDTAEIIISAAWARPTALKPEADSAQEMEMTPEAGHEMAMGSGVVSAAYMQITNTGSQALQLIGVTSAAAGAVEVHETQMENNVMRMMPLAALEIPAGATVALEPGGYHIMLLDLKQDLYLGEALALTMTFTVDGHDDPLTLTIGVPVLESAPVPGSITVTQAWARATALRSDAMPEMTPNPHAMHENIEEISAAYMQITNSGTQAVRLIGVTSAGAGVIEIHETQMENNVMRMTPMDALEIPAGESVILEPGGYHMMLMALSQQLYPGDALALTLIFDSGEQLVVGVSVQ